MSAGAAPRIFVERRLAGGERIELAEAASRHVQVLRLQPGAALVLFDGHGGEWPSVVVRMGRSAVDVVVGERIDIDRELPCHVTLAIGMPANERMDALVEKATELGVAALQPLVCERSVLRLSGERAERRLTHWRAVAVAASEQCGRTRLPCIEPVRSLRDWLEGLAPPPPDEQRFVLSPQAHGVWKSASAGTVALVFLSGPEGGLGPAEEQAALASGFGAVSLGARILRADTAPLAVLAACAMAQAKPLSAGLAVA